MTPKNVLVFPAGTEISQEICNSLKYSKFVRLVGGASVDDHGAFLYDNCINTFPYISEDCFVDYLNRIIDEEKIDYVYPANDATLFLMSESRGRINAPVIATDAKTVAICCSKNDTYRFLDGAWYLCRYFNSPDEVDCYPVFIKPSVGHSAIGAKKIDCAEDLKAALSCGTEYSVCEYLPGAEYTIDCFTDRHGTLRIVSPRTRDVIEAGIATHSVMIECDEKIRAIADDLNSKLKFRGAWFFQVKKNASGEYRLMEIAPRIAGTMSVTRNRGMNMPMMTLFDFWDYDIDILDNCSRVVLDRTFGRNFRIG